MKLAAHLVLTSLLAALPSAPLWAKGLDELSDKSPEAEQQPKADGGDGKAEGKEDPAFADDKDKDKDKAGDNKDAKDEGGLSDHPPVNALTQRFYFATSFGWVKASRNSGSWRSGGMSDFGLGYRLLPPTAKVNIAATYRYAPVAVSGQVNSYSYRGIWETHYLGARFDTNATAALRLVASVEAGYLKATLRSEDGLPGENSAARSGAMGAIGIGADYLMLESGVLAVGPRLYYASGVATTTQAAVSIGLSF